MKKSSRMMLFGWVLYALILTAAENTPLPHFMECATGVYSGGQPHGDAAFAELARRGIKTIVSVDGMRPDVEAARRHGLRYVHIPMGYDGVSTSVGLSLTRVMKEPHESIYVHCHHGKHRGPAAAAIACKSVGLLTTPQALALLEQAGTSREYAGLWRDVEAFVAPGPEIVLPDLAATAPVDDLAATMADLDRHWDVLQEWAKLKSPPSATHPPLAEAEAALLMKEGFRESSRRLDDKAPEELGLWMREAEVQAHRVEAALRENPPLSIDPLLSEMKAQCSRCHKRYRN